MSADLLLPETDEPSSPDRGSARLASTSAARSDVYLFHTVDGGDIESINGIVTLSDGLETAVYLSLFGGNNNDSGLEADDSRQWWGNRLELDPARTYRSETQFLLRNIPAVPANMQLVQDASERDLAWMVGTIATFVSVLVTMPGLNKVRIEINAEAQGTVYSFSFTEHWGKAA